MRAEQMGEKTNQINNHGNINILKSDYALCKLT